MNQLTRCIGWGAIVALLVLAGCSETTAPSKTPTKVIPVFKPLPTFTPITFSTAVPRVHLYDNQVDADDFSFYPAVITVTVGSTVHWHHTGVSTHNVQANDRTWGISAITFAGFFEYTFTRAGVYEYVCSFHAPGMRGTVVVLPSN